MSFVRISRLGHRLVSQLRNGNDTGVKELADCVNDLQRLEKQLPTVAREIQCRYLKSSSLLQPLTEMSEALVRESEALLQLAVGQSEGASVIAGTTALLHPAFEYLEVWRVDVESRAAALSECADIFAQVQQSEGRLRELLAPLTFMQTMFRIESAALSEDVRQVFTGLTSEIASVHREVTETFGQQFDIVSKTIVALGKIETRVRAQTSHIGNALVRHRDQIATSVASLQVELARNAQHDVELSATSRHIGDAVSSIVMALQVDDIVGQRLEAIRNTVTRCIADLKNPSYLLRQQVWCALAIQRAQITGVRKQLEEAEQTLQKGAEEIKAKVNALDTECLLLKEFEEVTVATNGSVELSFGMIGDVRALLTDVIACSRDLHQSMEPLRGVTTGLGHALERLSHRMRLIALNAQVQAVIIGSGTGLEVIAGQAAAVSMDTSTLADKVSNGIGRVVNIVQELTGSVARLLSEGEQQQQELQSGSEHHELWLHDLRNRTLEKLRLMGEAVDQICEASSALAEESSTRLTALAFLDDAASALNRAHDLLQHRLGPIDPSIRDKIGSGTYRMQAERDVHEAVMNDLCGNTSLTVPSITAEPVFESECQVEMF